MSYQDDLLWDIVYPTANDTILIINSAQDPFVASTIKSGHTGTIMLAEDNIAAIAQFPGISETKHVQHRAFHNYISSNPADTIDIAIMNMLYQPSKEWILYGLQVAAHALRPGGYLYIIGAKDRGILSIARRAQEEFGVIETLKISKGQRVLRMSNPARDTEQAPTTLLHIFANNKLDEGTRLLLEVLQVHPEDRALDIGCGAGFIGLHIARLAYKGLVTMVDASLAAVDIAQQAIEQSDLTNINVLASDGTKAVAAERFSLVVTNPPFHLGGIQTMQTAERFIREAAQVLHPQGHFYMVANRFLKYEPVLRTYFSVSEEVGGDTRYKVLRAHS